MISNALAKVRDHLTSAGWAVLIEPLTVYTPNNEPKVYLWPTRMDFEEAQLSGAIYVLDIEIGLIHPVGDGGSEVGLAELSRTDNILKLLVKGFSPITDDQEFSPAGWTVVWDTAPGSLITRITGQMYVDVSTD